jgi:Holliday junction resolvasome RuvABC endonuclease subunit
VIIAIDPSLRATGLAVVDKGTVTVSTIHTLPDSGLYQRINQICSTLWRLLAAGGPTPFVAIEGRSFGSTGKGRLDIDEFRGVLGFSLWNWAAVTMQIPPANVKKYACGKSNGIEKGDVRVQVDRRYREPLGVDPADDNQADALVMAMMVADQYGQPWVSVPKVNRSALDSLTWPDHKLEAGDGPVPF